MERAQSKPAATLVEWEALVQERVGAITAHAHVLHVAAAEQFAACPRLTAQCACAGEVELGGLSGLSAAPPPLTTQLLWEVREPSCAKS